MGFAVFHLEKASGNDAAMSAHIERTIEPKNADKTRTHLNRELVIFPDGVNTCTEAIRQRIETSGITRKISHNQVRAIRIMLSGTHEDMKQIEADGKLNDWCADNVDWLKKTFGAENVVSAVLHLDEKTPHIHATIVPIVTGERRKAKKEREQERKEKQPKTKKKYKKKPNNAPRLCADDMTARNKLKHYQDIYAEAMSKYGLQRGVDGSQVRHISTQQFYRELYVQNTNLKEENEVLQEQKTETCEEVRDLYDRKDEAQSKFLNMDRHLQEKRQELHAIESKLQTAKQEYEPYQAQEELTLIHSLFSIMKEQIRIANLCRKIGLRLDSIKKLLAGITLSITGKLYSPEHNRHIEVKDLNTRIEKEQDTPDRLRLTANGISVIDWFRDKLSINNRHEENKRKGVRM